MATLTGGSFKRVSPSDIVTRKSNLNQLVDVIQEDISGSATRRKYQVFVTGGVGPGVTSSLFQTVYDQDFTLQTSNAIFDMTVGLSTLSQVVTSSRTATDAATGKMLFPSQTLMMREKMDIYRQYAKTLLGNADSKFFAPITTTDTSDTNAAGDPNPDRIDEALFLSFRRLFARDKIKKETFALRFYMSASEGPGSFELDGVTASTSGTAASEKDSPRNGEHADIRTPLSASNLHKTSISGSVILTDIGAATNTTTRFGGEVCSIVRADDTAQRVGLVFYDHGTVILDLKKITSASQHMSGVLDGMSGGTISGTGTNNVALYEAALGTLPAGKVHIGRQIKSPGKKFGNPDAKFIPDFLASGSIDNIIDHIAGSRFQSGSLTAMTFQNITRINSTLIFCRATADEFNFSTNPTYTDTSGNIVTIETGTSQRSFTFPTTIGLHDEAGTVLAVAKLSRPVEKNDEKDVTFRVRLDF